MLPPIPMYEILTEKEISQSRAWPATSAVLARFMQTAGRVPQVMNYIQERVPIKKGSKVRAHAFVHR